MAIFDKKLREGIEFNIQIRSSLIDSHYEINTPLKTLSIDEMAEVLGYICQIRPRSFYEPFPHISIETYYGEITIFDANKGWLDNQIASNKFSIRCVFLDMLNVTEDDILNFNNDGCTESKLVKDSNRLIFQSTLSIEPSENVETLLNKLLNLSSRCERLYTISTVRNEQA